MQPRQTSSTCPDGDEQRQRDARYATLLEKLPFGKRQQIWEYDVRDALVGSTLSG